MIDGRVKPAERAYELLAPPAFALALGVARLAGAPPGELRARRGWLPDPPRGEAGPVLWLHGASAGEMWAASCLSELLARAGYRFLPAYTATNRAGLAVLERAGRRDLLASLSPWDAPGWIARAFDRWRPAALLLVETELWPELVIAAGRRGVPVVVVGGRIYRRDLPAYRLLRPWIAPMLRRLDAILVQSDVERGRFLRLGAPPERVVVTGNPKYLALTSPLDAAGGGGAAERGDGEPTCAPRVVFGSVHRDEVDIVLGAIESLGPGVRAVVAPRHLSTVPALLRAATRRGLPVRRWSGLGPDPDGRVLVLDSMGALRAAYAGAGVAVVGGGFGRHGGHNPYEPLLAGCPVVVGPNSYHFGEEVRALLQVVPETVACRGSLPGILSTWLSDARRRAAVLRRQRTALPDPGQLAARHLAALAPWLGRLGRPEAAAVKAGAWRRS